MIETLWQDLRFGTRMLIKNPGFASVALLTLALGIGANTTIFSLTNQVLLRRLPVERPEEIVILRAPGPKSGHVWSDSDSGNSFSYQVYKDLRDRNDPLAGLLARYPLSLSVAGQGQTERAGGELVSGNYFEVLGVMPALGRTFTAEDETATAASPVAVLSYGYWKRRFGADPSILNKTLEVNGTALTVVGVARAGFTGIQIGQMPDIFIPITMKAQMTPNWDGLSDPNDYWVAILGRLKPGFTPAHAEAALAPTYRAILEAELPRIQVTSADRQRFLEAPLLLDPGSHGRPILQREAKEPLLILTAMVGLVLLIACANLASLLLARGAARQREMGVRLALGARRRRLVRQLLTESSLLALAGGGLGLALGWWTLGGLAGALPPSLAGVGIEARPDRAVLGFAVAISAVTGILFGLVPALRATRASLQSTLKEQGSSVSEGFSNVRLRKGLIVSQIAVTTVLLIGAGLFARSLDNLKRLDLGVRIDHVIQFSVSPELNRYRPPQTVALADRLRQAIAALPGARSVSAAQIPVFADSNASANVTVEGYTAEQNENAHVDQNWVGPTYFSTMGIPLEVGRELSDADTASSHKVAVVNEAFARRFFSGRSPLGSHFAFGSGNAVHPDIEIVGVVKDSKHAEVRGEIKTFVYLPYAQNQKLGGLTFYVRTEQDPASMARALRQTVAEYDASLPVYDLKTLADQVDESLFNDRLLTVLSLCFALLASLLAAVGLYGVMAYSVTRRAREVGIRMALGAKRKDIIWLVLREVVRMAAVGLVVGLIGAFILSRVVESELFGVKSRDPVAFAFAVLLLGGVALMAGYLPARRAAGLDPIESLRCE